MVCCLDMSFSFGGGSLVGCFREPNRTTVLGGLPKTDPNLRPHHPDCTVQLMVACILMAIPLPEECQGETHENLGASALLFALSL